MPGVQPRLHCRCNLSLETVLQSCWPNGRRAYSSANRSQLGMQRRTAVLPLRHYDTAHIRFSTNVTATDCAHPFANCCGNWVLTGALQVQAKSRTPSKSLQAAITDCCLLAHFTMTGEPLQVPRCTAPEPAPTTLLRLSQELGSTFQTLYAMYYIPHILSTTQYITHTVYNTGICTFLVHVAFCHLRSLLFSVFVIWPWMVMSAGLRSQNPGASWSTNRLRC